MKIRNTGFPGFDPPAAGPDAPLDMLGACHVRVERQCRTLERIAPHLALHGADAIAREAAVAVLRYFDTAAVHHHADEEDDVFPAVLAAAADEEAPRILALTRALCDEHRALARDWATLRTGLLRLADGLLPEWTPEALRGFVAAYRAHLSREDQELIPLARRLLSPERLTGIGRAMAARRGLA